MNEEIIKYYFENKDIKQICYYKNGKLHNLKGPARIDILDKVIISYWYKDGLLHNDNSHAMELIFTDGRILQEWYYEGRIHRIGGSALSNSESYYIHGRRIHKPLYLRIISIVKKFIINTRRRIEQRKIKDFLIQEINVYNIIL
jgi:antitoxin component YwqK of YwqJK toxin-antitoxin module